jgi:hypothetical protein
MFLHYTPAVIEMICFVVCRRCHLASIMGLALALALALFEVDQKSRRDCAYSRLPT